MGRSLGSLGGSHYLQETETVIRFLIFFSRDRGILKHLQPVKYTIPDISRVNSLRSKATNTRTRTSRTPLHTPDRQSCLCPFAQQHSKSNYLQDQQTSYSGNSRTTGGTTSSAAQFTKASRAPRTTYMTSYLCFRAPLSARASMMSGRVRCVNGHRT